MLQLRSSIKIENDKRHNRRYNEDIKLLLSELSFITRYVDVEEKPIKIVYIGASPGYHLVKLMKLFDFQDNQIITFDLYDDQPLHPELEIYINDNPNQVTFYNELFTEETCDRYNNETTDVYLITDHKDPKYNVDPFFGLDKEAKEKWQIEKEESYAMDMEFQKKICIRLKPKYACLRFRPKHFYFGVTDENESLEYFKGVVWLPLFADLKSTESKLVTNNYDDIGYKWNLKNYQYRLNYYNDVVRESKVLNPLTGEQTPLPNMLGNMFEPLMTMVILIEYLNSTGVSTKSIRIKTLMDLYSDFIMIEYCSNLKGFFNNNEAEDTYIDPSLQLID